MMKTMASYYFLLFILMAMSCDQKKSENIVLAAVFKPWSRPDVNITVANSKESSVCIPTGKTLSQADCQAGYLCVPNAFDKKTGTCLLECGEKIADELIKRPDACPSDRRCMLLKSADLAPVGMFCLPVQKDKNMSCAAPLDEEACADGLSCLPTVIYQEEGKTIFSRYLCKRECSKEKPCPGEGEECLFPKYARKVKQLIKPNAKALVTCDVAKCQDQDPSCSCDKSLDYNCQSIIPGLSTGICVRTLGICGQPVALTSLKDFRGKSYLGETCNELTDDRICKQLAPKDSSLSIRTACSSISTTHEGVCLATCSWPSLDLDNDGVIGEHDRGWQRSCPEGYACLTDITRKLAMHVFIENKGAKKPCDHSKCVENQPCPAECGPGDAECLRVGQGINQRFFCGAPVGTCLAN